MQRVIEADIRAYCPTLRGSIPTKIPEISRTENFLVITASNGQSDLQGSIVCPIGELTVTFSVNTTTGESILKCNGCPKNPEGVSQKIQGVE